MFKNTTSQSVSLYAVDASTGLPKTGDSANMVFYVAKDDGTVTAITSNSGVPTESDSTNAKGDYKIAVSQTETNADKLRFTGKSSTTNVVIVPQTIYTLPANFTTTSIDSNGRVDLIKIAGTTQTARDLGASVLLDFTQALPSAPTANSVGESLFITDNLVGRIGTAQAGASTTITLDSGASSTDGRYIGYRVFLYGGTGGGIRGVGQERTIVAYNGTTKVATMAQAWGTNPDNTTKFMLYVEPWANVGIWNGTIVSSPATAGIPDVNIKNVNNVAATSVTTVNANIGSTQPVNFTGTAGSALVKTDMVDIAGAAVSTSIAQIGVNAVTVSDKTAYALTTGERDSIADALLDRTAGVETGRTLRQSLRLMASILLGKVSGGGTGTEVFRDTNDSKNRVTATVDSSGNRTAITLDAT